MSKPYIELINKYFSLRKDVGEDGVWIGECKSVKDNIKKEFEDIEKVVLKCKECPLGEFRLNACFGNGNPKAKIMFIGEGPGYEEDHRGEVFVGKAGKLLDKILETALNLDRSKIYITNIVKCHPMKDPGDPDKRNNDRPPTEKESRTCINLYLKQQVNFIKPKIIVTLGSPATKTILNTEKGITQLRGKVFDMKFGGVQLKVVPTYHPAYLLRNPPKKEEVYQDTKTIRSLL